MEIQHLQQGVRFRFDRMNLDWRVGFVKGRMGATPQPERCPIATGRDIDVNPWLLRRRLIELGEPLSDFCSPEPHDRVFAGLIVGAPAEHFRTDHALAKEVILPGKSMLDDVPEQVLTLLRVAKRRAGQHLIQGVMDSSGIS
jgi:hypothetical protein